MRYFYTADEIRAAEAPLLASLPDGGLMRRAAFGLATAIARELGTVSGKRVCAVVGSGDNGGDALWAATFLRRRGAGASAVLLKPERTHPQQSADALERHAAGEEDPEVLATIASAFGNLGPRYGLETLLKLRRHADPRVREGAAEALAGRDEERVFDALVELTGDPEPGIRDWATFALGTLSPQDTPTLRDALAARLDDSDDSTRIEAVHGLALRGDARALDATLDLLGEVGPHDDGGNAADTIWKRYALTQATVRLAALTGDARLKEHLPALDERLMGTAIEGDLRTAYDRVGNQ